MVIIEFGAPDINYQSLTLFEYAQIWTVENENDKTITVSYKTHGMKIIKEFEIRHIERRI